MTGTTTQTQALLRGLAPQVLGALLRRHGDFGAAEDAVQEALIAAAAQWPKDGVPDDPRGWLVVVARRRLADRARAEVARRRREERVAAQEERSLQALDDDDATPERDDTLQLLFLCCHPALSPSSAIALTLRAVGGLTTAEIARAFFVPEATMAQRISRAKASVKAAGATFVTPAADELVARLRLVEHVLYLVFNEGYAASSGADVVRADLSTEAIRLARALAGLVPDDAEAQALLALMLLSDARRDARTGPRGELIPLDEQDRSRWDPRRIAEGTALLQRAGVVGPYGIQAAIAALHDEAPSTEATDWAQIAALYASWLQLVDQPMVALNHAVAIAMVDGPAAGLARVDAVAPRLRGSHRVDAVRAHLLQRAGDRAGAIAAFRAAAAKATSLAERAYLVRQAARLEAEAAP